MIRKKRPLTLDTLKLTNPQRTAVAKLLGQQKSKYKKLLHEAHERMHIIADMSSSLEFWYNVNGSYEFVSPSCEAVLGYARTDFTHGELRLESIVHAEDRERFRRDKAGALEGGSAADVEYRFLAADGHYRSMLMTWNPVVTRRGKHIGVRISLRDMTEFQNCRHFSQAYERLTDVISDTLTEFAIFSVTPQRHIKSWNRMAMELFGYEREDIMGRDVALLFSASEHFGDMFPELSGITCDDVLEREAVFRSRDGAEFRRVVRYMPLCDVRGMLHQLTCVVPAAER
ncbi:MAG TPA: PAS domain-containing protein [Bacteroidota bacterium]|nr:PAS domain-containing protein [Bacteroidota bacterium]